MSQAESTAVITTGEVRFASMVKGVMEYLDDIDFFTSESYIKEGLNKVKQLAVDLQFMVKAGKKQDYVGQKLIEAAAWFTSQWKNAVPEKDRTAASGDRSGYRVAPEVIKMLEGILPIMDIPIDTFQAQGPTASVSIGQQAQAVGAGAAAAAAAAASSNSAPSTQTPSQATATSVNATDVGTDEEKKKAEEEEKKKQSWLKKTTYGVPNWGLILSGGLLTIGLASGVGAGLLKRKKSHAAPIGQTRALLAAPAVANPRKKGKGKRKRSR